MNKQKEKTRYSDEELAEFEKILQNMLNKAENSYRVHSTLSRNENDTTGTSRSHETVENSQESYNNEMTTSLAKRQDVAIINIEAALFRIKNKTYGICRISNKLISSERLRKCPLATTGIEEKLLEKKELKENKTNFYSQANLSIRN